MNGVLASTGADPLVIILAVAAGGWTLWNGRKTWRGDEATAIVQSGRDGIQHPVAGGRRQYQTRLGAGHFGLVTGPGLLLVGLGEGLRAMTGESREWWLFELVAGFGGILVVAGAAYALWYFWFGVPDRLRPPCQRGWEMVDGELRLVRPEAFHEHPKHSSIRAADEPAGYDPWR